MSSRRHSSLADVKQQIGIFDQEVAVVKGKKHQDIRYNLGSCGVLAVWLAASRLGCGDGEAI